MNWGLGGNVWMVRMRELEHFVRRFFRVSRADPVEELPDAELADHERQAAVQREAARRMFAERR